MNNNSQIEQPKTRIRSKKFSKAQQMDVYSWIMEGLENNDIMDKFTKKYHPDNNYLTTDKDRYNFRCRLQNHRDVIHKDENFKLVIKSSHQGLGKKNIRINALKKRASVALHELDKIDYLNHDKQISKSDYISLTSALNKELREFCKQIAIELNEYTTGTSFQVNIDNRQIKFEGQAVATALSVSEMEQLQAQQKALEEPQQED